MPSTSTNRTRPFRIIAQDPAVPDLEGKILTAEIDIPHETLLPGPCGHRVQVIDFDSASRVYYPAGQVHNDVATTKDRKDIDIDSLINDPAFHAENVYAVVMRVLARFENALGRHVSWKGDSHQLKLVPHAFADANAFYSRDVEAILFGYFPRRDGKGMIYTCLSHDIIVHETTHALLDGLCDRFIYASSPDQAAFHEAFADIIALLSVFSLKGVAQAALAKDLNEESRSLNLIPKSQLSRDALGQLALLGLAEQMGKELQITRGGALRRSVELTPSPKYYQSPEFLLPHRRGEILVAAVMNAFIQVWAERLNKLNPVSGGQLDLDRAAEEGADVADCLLTMAIRALDYLPPLHMLFHDYLNALITADVEIRPDDSRYRFRDHLRNSFTDYGIQPFVGTAVTSKEQIAEAEKPAAEEKTHGAEEPGTWASAESLPLTYDHTHFASMMRDPDEVFHFIWENREVLELDGPLCDEAFSKVISVRPCLRIAPDGFALRETIATFYQVIRLRADELDEFKIKKPEDMPADIQVALYGGGTLVFNEYGRLKYYIHNALGNGPRQSARIADLWHRGAFVEHDDREVDFAKTHRMRAANYETQLQEEW